MPTSLLRMMLAALCALFVLGMPAAALADPDDHGGDHDHQPPREPPFSGPIAVNMTKLFGSTKDGTTSSDLAFWGDLAVAGNYHGFRIFDISNPSAPELLSDFPCYGPQNDVAIYEIRGRLYLWQSIDRPLKSVNCQPTASAATAVIKDEGDSNAERARYGFEGIRMFDITNPREPEFITGVRTACGSHTHTLVPDRRNQRLFIYVSSYPLLTGITPTQDRDEDRPCVAPHRKISIIEVPFADPANMTVRERPLAEDTAYAPNRNPPFQACHDVQAVLSRDLAIGACGGDVQIWDISDRGRPTTLDENRHTHFHQEQWDFMHNAMASYDGKVFAFVDETGGGAGAECDGKSSDDGFMYLYRAVSPGEPAGAEIGRYMIPRAQGTQVCVTHNGSIIPVTDGRYLASLANYQGGTSIVDFTNPAAAREIAYIDLPNSDAWSSYWYRDHVFQNGGLNRRAADGSSPCGGAKQPACLNPGFEVYRVTDEDGTTLRTRDWHHYNPQTQEHFQETGR